MSETARFPPAAATSAPRSVLGPSVALLVLLGLCGCGEGGGGASSATSIDPPAAPDPPGDLPAFPFERHLEQEEVTAGRVAFDELFVIGDELFEARFNALDGAGALRLPDGSPLPGRFARVPPGGGRFTGPNAQACSGCHNTPFGTSAGEAAANVAQDPARAGAPPFNLRNTPSLFGSGILQLLAEEMSDELQSVRRAAEDAALPGGPSVERDLVAKGISFGRIRVERDLSGSLASDTSQVRGVSPDLVVRPFGWKGNVASLRDFCRNAARNELGMEAEELVAKDESDDDPDGDSVARELSVGDVTALTVYVAAQETPTTVAAMVRRGLLAPPASEVTRASERGRELFTTIGCTECHVPELALLDAVFTEPSERAAGAYRDRDLDPPASTLDPLRPFRFDVAREGDFPRPEPRTNGGVRIALFGDLRRHYMGTALADAQPTPVDSAEGAPLVADGVPVTVGVGEFLTAELWGAGSTGPWLHDGRAGTLEEAIVLHGTDAPPPPGDPLRSEAQAARDAFVALPDGDREAMVTFLRGLILFEIPEE